jgi:hypothetical protein
VSDNDLHVSDLRWDRLISGELDADARAAALAHASACPRCAARLDTVTLESQAFARRPPFESRRPGARGRTWRRWSAPIVLAAAAAVLIVARARPDPAPGGGERAKGTGPSLVLEAGPADRLAPVVSGDRVHPGDSIQAGYTAARDGFGAVLARDGSGRAMTYVPSGGDAMIALPAGSMQSFPESTVLDDILGEEDLVVVWCEAAHPLRPLLAELEARADVTAPAGCTLQRVVLDKRAPPR